MIENAKKELEEKIEIKKVISEEKAQKEAEKIEIKM
jgi:hypothetical protein